MQMQFTNIRAGELAEGLLVSSPRSVENGGAHRRIVARRASQLGDGNVCKPRSATAVDGVSTDIAVETRRTPT